MLTPINDILDLPEYSDGEPVDLSIMDLKRADLSELPQRIELQTELEEGCGITLWRAGKQLVITVEFRCDEWKLLSPYPPKEAARRLAAAIKGLCRDQPRYKTTRERWFAGDAAIRFEIRTFSGDEVVQAARAVTALLTKSLGRNG